MAEVKPEGKQENETFRITIVTDFEPTQNDLDAILRATRLQAFVTDRGQSVISINLEEKK